MVSYYFPNSRVAHNTCKGTHGASQKRSLHNIYPNIKCYCFKETCHIHLLLQVCFFNNWMKSNEYFLVKFLVSLVCVCVCTGACRLGGGWLGQTDSILSKLRSIWVFFVFVFLNLGFVVAMATFIASQTLNSSSSGSHVIS